LPFFFRRVRDPCAQVVYGVFDMHLLKPLLFCLAASLTLGGCAVVAVADAAVTVVATGVKVGAAVVETTVDVAAAGVQAAVGSDDDK
jgi:hypothetical protein